MRTKCSYCGGKASQCRCPREVLETEQVMQAAQRKGRLFQMAEPKRVTAEEREMILFEERFKDHLASRSE